jgi:hypothetical protein
MKRLMVLLTGVVALLAVLSFSSHDTATASPPASLQTASIPALSGPVKVPRPKFTRTMYAATQLARSDAKIDACRGPVAIALGAGRPVLVAQHDYCGGSAWMPKLKLDDGVRLKGDGIYPGIYVVTKISHQTRHEATVGDLPNAVAVLQTCVSKHTMVLVGLEWISE